MLGGPLWSQWPVFTCFSAEDLSITVQAETQTPLEAGRLFLGTDEHSFRVLFRIASTEFCCLVSLGQLGPPLPVDKGTGNAAAGSWHEAYSCPIARASEVWGSQ